MNSRPAGSRPSEARSDTGRAGGSCPDADLHAIYEEIRGSPDHKQPQKLPTLFGAAVRFALRPIHAGA
jgi:hypothetical protein